MRDRLGKRRLNLDGAAHRFDGTRELREKAVTSGLHHTAAMCVDARLEDVLAKGLYALESAFLVLGHKAGITDHVGYQNRSHPTLRHTLRYTTRHCFLDETVPLGRRLRDDTR
jgi:hypothetical protein